MRLLLVYNNIPNSNRMDRQITLFEASRSGNAKVLKLLIDQGANVEARDRNGDTALIVACATFGNIECVKVLLVKNANPNLCGNYGTTALLNAAKSGDVEILRMLIDHGADVHARDTSGNTALSYACETFGNIECVKFLLTKNVSPILCGRYVRPALLNAAKSGDVEILKLLIHHGADVHTRDTSGSTTLSCACETFGNIDCVRFLLDNNVNPNSCRKNGVKALLNAAKSGDIKVLQLLIDHGVNIHGLDESNNTALIVACETFGNVECVRFLLDKNVNPNLRGKYGVSALLNAAKSGDIEILKLLIDHRADVHIKDSKGDTALSYACMRYGNKQCVQVLLCKHINSISCGEYRRPPLLNAALSGDVDVLELLIDNGADVHAIDWNGNTALSCACMNYGNIQCVKSLLAKNVHPNKCGQFGVRPLLCAAKSGDIDVLSLLIDHGANIHTKDSNGDTALFYACKNFGNINCVKFLLDKGVDPNSCGQNGVSALLYTAQSGDVEMMKFLIDHGADVNAGDKDGNTALLFACAWRGNIECIRFLLSNHANPNSCGEFGVRPVLNAARSGDVDVLKLLIYHGADIHIKDSNGDTALAYACVTSGNIECVRFLLDKNVNPSLRGKYGVSALLNAAKSGDIEILKLLIDHRADVHIKDSKGDTALSYACMTFENTECIKILLAEKVNPNRLEQNGRTVLMRAAKSGDIQVLKVLIDHGADVHIKDRSGKTALSYACMNFENIECIKTLLAQKVNPNWLGQNGRTVLMRAAKSGDIQVLKVLIDHGADVHIEDKNTSTALSYACKRAGNIDCVKFLLNKGINPNSSGQSGRTALMNAAKSGDVNILKLLIDHEADVHASDRSGRTALSYACLNFENIECVKFLLAKEVNPNSLGQNGGKILLCAARSGDFETLKLLIDHGADVNARDEDKNTALHFACAWPGNIECVKFLAGNAYGKYRHTSAAARPGNGGKIKRNLRAYEKDTACEENMALSLDYNNYGNIDCVRYLLTKHANPNTQSRLAGTALCISLITQNLDITKLLIEHRADLESESSDGVTPYLLAARTLNFQVIELLHQARVNTKAVTKSGRNAIMVVLREIKNRKLPFDETIKKVLHSMVDNGVPVNHKKKNGATALMDAAAKENYEILQFLLDVKANVHVRGARGSPVHGETALSLLLEYGDWSSKKWSMCVRELVKRGAVNSLSNPLLLLKKLIHENKREIIYLLLTNGVTPGTYQEPFVQYTQSGMAIDSPLKQALRAGNTGLLRCFLNNLVLCPNDISDKFYRLLRKELVSEHDSSAQEIVRIMDEFYSQPLSLFTQSFVIVSNALGGVPGRVERVNSLHLEQPIKNLFLFKGKDLNLTDGHLLCNLLEHGDWSNEECQNRVRELVACGAVNSLPKSLYLLKRFIHENKREIIYLLLTNGVAPARYQPPFVQSTTSGMAIDSPLKQALGAENTGLLRCFLNNLVLCPNDISNEFYNLHRKELVKEQDRSTQEIVRLMDEFYSQPLSLFTQSFVIVSNAVGGVPGRLERVNSLPVKEEIQEMLLFRKIQTSSCVTDSHFSDDTDSDSSTDMDSCSSADIGCDASSEGYD